jgi:hypothetical protein
MSAIRDDLADQVKAATDIRQVIDAHVKLQHKGDVWKGLCPFHEETDPSFTVYADHFYCFGCGVGGDVFNFLMKLQNRTFKDVLDELAAKARVVPGSAPYRPSGPAGSNGNGNGKTDHGPVVHEWQFEYRDEHGALIVIKHRKDYADGTKLPWYSPKLEQLGIGVRNLPLYRLDNLLKNPDLPVLLVEGEKCADILAGLGYVAVSLAGGAEQKDFGSTLDALKGRDVYLWPDHDQPGHRLMARVAQALEAVGTQSVRMIYPQWEDMQPKDDAADFVNNERAAGESDRAIRHTIDGLMRYQFTIPDSRSYGDQESGTSGAEARSASAGATQAGFSPRAVRLSELPEPAARRFFVAGLIPEKVVTTLYGDGGLGKSYVALYMGMLVAIGQAFNDRAVMQSRVMYVDGELDLDEVCRRAYQVARGLGHDKLPDCFFYYSLEGRSITEPQVQVRLQAEIVACGAEFIILDSLTMASYGGDPKDAPDMIKVVKFLEGLAVTTLAIDHIVGANPSMNQSQYREFGSVFKRNAVRSSIQLVKAAGGGLSLLHKKANFGPPQQPTNLVMSFEPGNKVTFRFVEATDEAMAGIGDHMPAIERVWLELARYQDGSTADGLAVELDVAVSTVRNHLTALKKLGRAERLGDGRWQALRAIPDS